MNQPTLSCMNQFKAPDNLFDAKVNESPENLQKSIPQFHQNRLRHFIKSCVSSDLYVYIFAVKIILGIISSSFGIAMFFSNLNYVFCYTPTSMIFIISFVELICQVSIISGINELFKNVEIYFLLILVLAYGCVAVLIFFVFYKENNHSIILKISSISIGVVCIISSGIGICKMRERKKKSRETQVIFFFIFLEKH